MSNLDWTIVIGYLVLALGLGLYHMRSATRGMANYFLSGRKATWWLLGTSMAATSFAADTPLAVSGFIIKSGISWNWYWWCSAMAGMVSLYFFARLWRRSRVLTDAEFIELRYSGRPARILRAYLSIHSGVLCNCIVIGWVNLAMVKVLANTIDIDQRYALWFCFGFSLVYTMMAGLRGVMATDFIQFFIAMFGSIYLAVVAVKGVGGLGSIFHRLAEVHGAERAEEITAFFPASGSELFVPVMAFIFFQWWSAGNPAGGGGNTGHLVQRMLSAKNEKHAFFGVLWYNVAQYCLRSWPWILAGLCGAILYPAIADPEIGYILLMNEFLPSGILGLMVVSFFAAYMSTIDTHLNWGASYLVNDIYKRFINPRATERQCIVAAMVMTAGLALLGMGVTTVMSSIRDGWYIITSIGGGVSIIYVLRWYWWRINAWSEIAAMLTGLACTVIFRMGLGYDYPQVLFWVVPISLGAALAITFLTRPVDREHLTAFYTRIRPGGRLWAPVSRAVPGTERDTAPSKALPAFIFSIGAIYGTLFGVGKLLLGPRWLGALLLAIAVICAALVWRYVAGLEWGRATETSDRPG